MKKKNFKFGRVVIFGAVLLFVIKMFFCDFFVVSGNSMTPTYKNGNVILIQKFYEQIERNDVVVFTAGNGIFKRSIVKRIIGLPYDEIIIKNGCVYINGKLFDDDLISQPIVNAGMAAEKLILLEGEYFVLGDNRNESIDSRNESIGIIKETQIIGKVFTHGE